MVCSGYTPSPLVVTLDCILIETICQGLEVLLSPANDKERQPDMGMSEGSTGVKG